MTNNSIPKAIGRTAADLYDLGIMIESQYLEIMSGLIEQWQDSDKQLDLQQYLGITDEQLEALLYLHLADIGAGDYQSQS